MRSRPWSLAGVAVAAGMLACSSDGHDSSRGAPPATKAPPDAPPSAPWALSLGAGVDALVRSGPRGAPFLIGALSGRDAAGRIPIVAAYDAEGTVRWTVTATSAGVTRPIDAVALADGGLAVIGALQGRTTIGERTLDAREGDIFVLAVTADGAVRFAKVIVSSSKGSSTVAAIAASPDGGWIVGGQLFDGAADFGAGTWTTAPGRTEAVLVRYDARGESLWSHHWGDTANPSGAEIDGVVVDPLGHVVVTGIESGKIDLGAGPIGEPASSRDVFVASFRADGELLWSRTFATPSSSGALALTPPVTRDDGRIVVGGTIAGAVDWGAGRRQGTPGKISGFVAAYDSVGHLAAGGETAFVPVEIVVDGDAFSVAGFDPSDGRTLRAAVAHVRLDGAVLDLRRIGVGSVRSIAPGPGDDVYVCGEFQGALTILGAPALQATAGPEGFLARLFP